MNSSYSNVNSNHHHTRETTNPNGTNNTTINEVINTQSVSTTTVNGQIYKTSISGINDILSQSCQQRLPYINKNSNLLRTRDSNRIFRYCTRRNTDDLHYSSYSFPSLSPASICLLRSPRKQLRKLPKTLEHH